MKLSLDGMLLLDKTLYNHAMVYSAYKTCHLLHLVRVVVMLGRLI